MFGSFAFVFAVFVKFHFWNAAHRTYFCAIVALSAGCALHPEIFSFGLLGHNVFPVGWASAHAVWLAPSCIIRVAPFCISERCSCIAFDGWQPPSPRCGWLIGWHALAQLMQSISKLKHGFRLLLVRAVPAIYSFYSSTLVTTPAPTVLPPSRTAKRSPSSIAIGLIISTSTVTLSPGIHISAPPSNFNPPVISVVRK